MTNKIRFRETADVKEFVAAACRCDFDIDVCYNRITVDAKSIMGVLSMDLSHDVEVRCHGEDEAFNKLLQKFTVA